MWDSSQEVGLPPQVRPGGSDLSLLTERKAPGGGEVSDAGAGCLAVQMCLPVSVVGWGALRKGTTALTVQAQAGLGPRHCWEPVIALGALCGAPEHGDRPGKEKMASALSGPRRNDR